MELAIYETVLKTFLDATDKYNANPTEKNMDYLSRCAADYQSACQILDGKKPVKTVWATGEL